jgi:hypothetical protein
MSDRYLRLAAALPLWLACATPSLAQAIAAPAATNFWPLLLPNAAVALIGLGWMLLMRRRRE